MSQVIEELDGSTLSQRRPHSHKRTGSTSSSSPSTVPSSKPDRNAVETFVHDHHRAVLISLALLLTILVHVWLLLAILWNPSGSVGPLVFVCIAWAAAIFYGPVLYVNGRFDLFNTYFMPVYGVGVKVWNLKFVPKITFAVVFVAFFGYLIYDAWDEKVRLISIGGLFLHIAVCVCLSTNPSKIKWRPVIWGIGMQFAMGMLVLRWHTGHVAFTFFSNQTVAFLNYAQNGTRFVYGFLANPEAGPSPLPSLVSGQAIFAFAALQTVIYFGAVVALLYHWGIIQFILMKVAYVMQFTLGTTAAESLNAAACIFLGQTEAALLIKPCLDTMTESEIHAVMTAGYACIAGSLFAAYISFGACPDYLLSASVMSAPASLAVAKLLMPETEVSQQTDMSTMKFPKMDSNVLEAISNGAVIAVGYVAAIIANLVVIMGMLAFVDATFGWFGNMVGYPELTLEEITGYVFFPLALVMGSSEANTTSEFMHDTKMVAELMGTKTIVNEFVAYQKLGCFVVNGQIGERARMIATYALCGFSNIGSIGIQLGIMSGMCPKKSAVFARVAVRGLLAGSMACFMTACVAGILVPAGSLAVCPAQCNN